MRKAVEILKLVGKVSGKVIIWLAKQLEGGN